jgi:peptide/nickel transport system permease protein
VNSRGSTWARLVANRSARWPLVVIGALIVAAIAGPLLTTQSCVEQLDIVRLKNAPPSLAHLFGTDAYSRDVLARVLCGARISLAIGVLAVVVSTTIGAAYGLVAGYVGGRLDNAMMRLLDAFMAIPRVLILIAVLTIWHPVPLVGLIVLIGATGWFTVSLLVRAETKLAKNADYVASARALGASDVRIVLRHLLPNVAMPIIVSSTLAVGNVIALEAGLSYLGIGAQPPTASWGSIFLDGIDTFSTAWWVVLFPGIAIVVTVVAFNALGDALRDVLDPRQVHLDRPISNPAIELESVSRPASPPSLPPASPPPPPTTHRLAQNG